MLRNAIDCEERTSATEEGNGPAVLIVRVLGKRISAVVQQCCSIPSNAILSYTNTNQPVQQILVRAADPADHRVVMLWVDSKNDAPVPLLPAPGIQPS